VITETLINFTFNFSLTFVSSYTGSLACFFLILAWEKIQLFQLFLLFTVIRLFIRRRFVISSQNVHNRVLFIHVTALVLNYPDRKIPDATKFSWVSLCHPVCLRNNLFWSEHSQPKCIYVRELIKAANRCLLQGDCLQLWLPHSTYLLMVRES